MTTPDYSINDFIDINNQLFRRARDNMGENKKPIKDLDDDDKAKGEKNLLLYGSELVNNLKQINYTFDQIERYVFLKSKVTKKTIKKVIEKGPKSKVKDIREPIEEILEALPELEGVRDFMKYEFIDKELDYDLSEYEKYFRKLNDEYQKIEEELVVLMADEEIEYDEIDEKGSLYLKDMKEYINQLLEEGKYLENKIIYEKSKAKPRSESESESEEEPEKPEDIGKKERGITKIQSLIRGRKAKEKAKDKRYHKKAREESEERKKEWREHEEELDRLRDQRRIDEGLTDEEPETEEGLPADLHYPQFGEDTSDIKNAFESGFKNPTIVKRLFKALGFKSKTINKLSLNQIRQIIDAYDQGKVVGAGRYRGGVGVKGMKRGVRKEKPAGIKRGRPKAEPKAEPEPEPEDPHSDDELELIDEKDPRKEAEENEEVADEMDTSLRETVNTTDSTPSQTYIARANDLMMSLIQFLGRTTVLYITRIDKNINYLDEDQVKLIFDNASKLKPNLDKLQYYKNTGGAIIKETIYNQLTAETLTLYNKINDNIRNYKKLTNYKVFEGAGIDHYKGGFFIQSADPFIRQSLTKRNL